MIDLDATLVTAHSEKENTAPTYERGFGFHPLIAMVDRRQAGTGEPVAVLLRLGNAGSDTADDHIMVTRKALTSYRPISAGGRARRCSCAPTAPARATSS